MAYTGALFQWASTKHKPTTLNLFFSFGAFSKYWTVRPGITCLTNILNKTIVKHRKFSPISCSERPKFWVVLHYLPHCCFVCSTSDQQPHVQAMPNLPQFGNCKSRLQRKRKSFIGQAIINWDVTITSFDCPSVQFGNSILHIKDLEGTYPDYGHLVIQMIERSRQLTWTFIQLDIFVRISQVSQ